jgi:hypothetical protein
MREFGHVLTIWVKNERIWTCPDNMGKKTENVDMF